MLFTLYSSLQKGAAEVFNVLGSCSGVMVRLSNVAGRRQSPPHVKGFMKYANLLVESTAPNRGFELHLVHGVRPFDGGWGFFEAICGSRHRGVRSAWIVDTVTVSLHTSDTNASVLARSSLTLKAHEKPNPIVEFTVL